jgi:hypothetical protein
MVTSSDEEGQAICYLLGELSEAEQSRLEERFFKDAAYGDFLQSVEDDLIDEYVRGALAPARRERFETRFLSSARRREKVLFAKTWLDHQATSMPAPTAVPPPIKSKAPWWAPFLAWRHAPHPALSYAMAAAALLALTGGVWFYSETRRLRAELWRAQAGRQTDQHRAGELQQQIGSERARSEELAAQLRSQHEQLAASRKQNERLQQELVQRERPDRSQKGSQGIPGAIASFILAPGIRSGDDGPTRLIVPRGTRAVRLQLDLERGDDYPGYRVELRTAGGNLVWSRDVTALRSTAAGPAVAISLPAAMLAPGEYELALRGISGKGKFADIGYYYFSFLIR